MYSSLKSSGFGLKLTELFPKPEPEQVRCKGSAEPAVRSYTRYEETSFFFFSKLHVPKIIYKSKLEINYIKIVGKLADRFLQGNDANKKMFSRKCFDYWH